MRKTTAEEEGATSEADGGGDLINFPLLQTRVVSALTAKSRTVRVLLSSSPAFRLLLFGSSISMLGTRISTVAFPMLVLHLNKSPFIAGLVTFAAIAPSVMAYVPAGVLVDRWNPRRVMLASESLRGLIIVSVVIGLVISRMHVRIWYLIIAMVLEEILEIFSTLAERRYLSRVIERDKIVSQQSSIEVRAHAVVLAGRPVGPFLFSIEPFLPFLADAASFIASVTSLLLIRRVDEPQVQARRLLLSEVRSDIRQGFRWLADDRRALLTLFLMAGTSMVAQALILMFLDEAHSKQLSTVAIGIVLAASGAGGAVGSFGSRFVPEVARNSWLTIELIAWSLALFFLSLAGGKSVYLGAGAMFILGLTGAIGNVEFGTYLVRNVADDMIAKVAGIGQMLAIGACAVGPVLGGYAIQRFQVQGAIFILLVIVAFLAFASWLFLDVSQQVTRSGKVIQKLVRDGEHAMRPETVTLDPAPVSSSAANHPDGNRNNRQKVVAFGDRMSLVPDNGRPSSCIDVSILTCEDAGS